MMFFAKSKKNGFTLMEVCMATAILLVGVVGIVSLFPVALNANLKAKNRTIVAMLAKWKIEEMKREVFISGSNWENIDTIAVGQSFSTPYNVAPYDRFSWTQTMTVLPPGDLKQVTLRISWPEGSTTRDEDFDVFIAKR